MIAATMFTVAGLNVNAEKVDSSIVESPVKLEIKDFELENKGSESQITPMALFVPDRCILVDFVKETSSAYEVLTPSGFKYVLPKAAKHGFWNPKSGKEVEIMLDIHSKVVGWKVI